MHTVHLLTMSLSIGVGGGEVCHTLWMQSPPNADPRLSGCRPTWRQTPRYSSPLDGDPPDADPHLMQAPLEAAPLPWMKTLWQADPPYTKLVVLENLTNLAYLGLSYIFIYVF